VDVLDDLEALATGLSTTGERAAFWTNVVRMVEFSVGLDGLASGDITALNAAIVASDGALSLNGLADDLLWVRPAGVDETGTSGNDTMNGSTGDDRLAGGNGHDTLYGLNGNDRLEGGFGDDVLVGGAGHDYLLGGAHDFGDSQGHRGTPQLQGARKELFLQNIVRVTHRMCGRLDGYANDNRCLMRTAA
jgi:Ca2+-binding RTX toxin-like protein